MLADNLNSQFSLKLNSGKIDIFLLRLHGFGVDGWEIAREQALLIDQSWAMVLKGSRN